MRIVWSRRAVQHLTAIREYIESEDSKAAERVAERVLESVERLAEQPQMGRLGRVRGTRELIIPSTSYIIPYRLRRERVELIAVLHGRRRRPKRL